MQEAKLLTLTILLLFGLVGSEWFFAEETGEMSQLTRKDTFQAGLILASWLSAINYAAWLLVELLSKYPYLPQR